MRRAGLLIIGTVLMLCVAAVPTARAGELTLRSVSTAPESIRVGVQYAVATITCTSDGPVVLTGMTIRNAGTAPIDAIALAIYRDTNNNGSYDTGDPVVAERPSSQDAGARTWTYRLPNLAVAPGNPLVLFWVITTTAELRTTVELQIASSAAVATAAGGTVAPDGYPIGTNRMTVVPPPTLSVSTEPGPGAVDNAYYRGGSSFVARFRLTAQDGPVTVTALRIRYLGSATFGNFIMSLWVDRNGDDTWQRTDTPIRSRGYVGNVFIYDGLALTVTPDTRMTVLMTVGCAPSQVGRTLQFEISDASEITLAPPASVNPASVPLRTPVITIRNPQLSLTAGPVAGPADNTVVRQTQVPLASIRLTALGAPVTVTGLKIRQVGTATPSNYAISLWMDRAGNGSGTWQREDGRLASRGWLGNEHLWDRRSFLVTPGTDLILFLTGVGASPTQVGKTLCFEIAGPEAITLASPATVSPAGFPFRTPDITIIAPPPPELTTRYEQVAGASIPVITDNVIGKQTLTARGGTVTLTSLRIQNAGDMPPDAIIFTLALDSNRNGVWDQASDVAIGARGAVRDAASNSWLWRGLSITIAVDQPEAVFWLVSAGPAGAGRTVQLRVVDASWISVAAPAIVKPDNLPLASLSMTARR